MNRLRHYITLFSIAATSFCASAASSVLDLSDHANDSTIVFPESFETDTHKMMQNWYLQTYTELDKEADSRPDVAATDEEIIKRLQAIPTTIEMPYNSVVRAYIDMYTGKKRSLVETMLGMSLYYMPIFEQALEREGLPMELKYLPVIESALNPDAVSRAGATGLWQIMIKTARGLGLEVTTLVDERRDPIRSSEAATKYLRQLYEIYNDWSLAIAAYNCGPGNVNKAMRRAGEEGKDFWAIYPYLPAETRGYVPCFIAATYVMNYYHMHNISPALAKRPILTDSVHVNYRVNFKQISDILQIPVEELKILNPQYRKQQIPGHVRPYALVLPATQTSAYIMSEQAIAGHDAKLYAPREVVEPSTGMEPRHDIVDGKEGEWVSVEDVKSHKVQRRETLSSIAKKYGVTVASLKEANGGISKVRRGRTIKVVTTKRVFKPYEDEQLAKMDAEESGMSAISPDGNDDTANYTPSEMEIPEEMPVVVPLQESADTSAVTYHAAALPAEADTTAQNDVTAMAANTPESNVAQTPDSTNTTSNATTETDSKVAGTFRNSKAKQTANTAADTKAESTTSAKNKTAEKSTAKPEKKETKKQESKKSASSDKSSSKAQYHTVRSGESLYIIAQAHGTTVNKLRKLNGNIRGNKIKPGDKIRVK